MFISEIQLKHLSLLEKLPKLTQNLYNLDVFGRSILNLLCYIDLNSSFSFRICWLDIKKLQEAVFKFGDRREVFKLRMQTGDLARGDRVMHWEQAGWNGLRAEMEDHSGAKGDVVDDGKLLQLGCGCKWQHEGDEKKMTLPEMPEINWKGEESQNNARYAGFAGTGTVFLAGFSIQTAETRAP